MGKGLDNYYLILGLDFAKPESDLTVINRRIQEKARFWNANSDKGKMQQKYRQYKSQVMDIGKVMKTEKLRIAEAQEAMAFVSGILEEEKKFFAGQTEIEETQAKGVMDKCGLWPEMFEKLSGLKIIPDRKAEDFVIEKVDPNPKPDKVAKFKKYTQDLNILHKENLYDFLADGTVGMDALQILDGEELIKKYSNPLKERVKNGRTEEAVSTRTLCAACEEVFDPKNKQLRENYHKYLVWNKIDAVISSMRAYAGTKKVLNGQQSVLFTDEITEILHSRQDAKQRFQQICVFYELKAEGAAQHAGTSNQVLCGHCYRMSDISDGKRKCTSCGKDLYIQCPKCGKEALASSKACGHCGFVFDNVKKAEVYCDIAQQAIDSMDFEKARSSLARAKELAGKLLGRIDGLEEKLKAREGALAKEAAQLKALAEKKSFYKAAEVLRSIQKKAPTAKIAQAVLIETSVKEAEQLYKNAIKETSEQKLIETCSQIVNICPDYPGVDTLILKYRPKPPSNIKITCDSHSCSNTLTWQKSPSAGMISYKILRKANAAPASCEDSDAEEIGTAGDTEFIDVSPKPGVNYFYNIYAVRAGAASEPAYANAVNLSRLRFLKKEEGDGYIRIEWEPLPKNAEVTVCRRENVAPEKISDGELVRASGNCLLDNGVKNEGRYYYLFAVTYHIGGKNADVLSAIGPFVPSSLPEPVDGLVVDTLEDDMYEARWEGSGEENVMLYYTQKRVSLKYGDVSELDQVEKLLKPVERVSSSSGKCRFRLPKKGNYVVVPVTIKGQTAVVGEQAVIAKTEKIKVESTELVNSNLRIAIQWPQDAVSVLAIYANDGYAKNLEDRAGKAVRNFSKKKYEADTGIYLQNIEKKDYYIVLYAASRVNGEMVYSQGTRVFYSNRPKPGVQYAIRVKGLINKQIEVEFKSEEPSFILPDIDLVCKQGGIPVYLNSGTVMEHIDKREVQGSYTEVIPLKAVPKNSYLKAFFTDEDMSDEVSLRPVYGTNFKIS